MRIQNSNNEGKTLVQREYQIVDRPAEKITFPPVKGTALAIFWATWCAPCKLEMARLNESITDKKIPSGKIFAINFYDSVIEQRKFQAEKNYPFIFITGNEIGSELNIRATPTTLLVKDGIVENLSTGLSIFGIWKAEGFLN